MHSQSLHASHDLGSAIADLSQGANWLAGASLSRLRELADECSLGVVRVAKDWVRAACEAKHIGFDQPVAAEEILSGPTAVLRYLRVLSLVLQAVERTGLPTLPGRPRTNSQRRLCVPVLPVDSMFDRLAFLGLQAEVWRQAGTSDTDLFTSSWQTSITSVGKIAGVLGAGNVSSIPASDMLFKIFHDREAVLLKLNPVFCISEIDKAVLWGPLSNFPKPAWYPTNRSANQIAWSLLELYEVPTLTRLPKLFFHALRG